MPTIKDSLKSILEGTPGIFLALNAAGEVIASNRAFKLLPLAQPGENGDKSAPAPAPSQQAVSSACQLSLKSGTPLKIEMGSEELSGLKCWYQGETSVLRDTEGKIAGVVSICLEVTDRKALEQKLAATERLSNLITNTVEDALFCVRLEADGEYRFLSVNPAFLRATGLAVSQVVGRSVREVIPAPSLGKVLKNYERAIRERRTLRWEEKSEYPAGTKYGDVTITPVIENDGSCVTLVGGVHDVTERKIAEIEKEKAYAILNAVVEGTTDAVFVKDSDGRYIMANAGAAQWVGKRLDEVIGRTDSELFPPETAAGFVANDEAVKRWKRTLTFEESGVIRDRKFWILATKGPYLNSQGGVVGTVGISRDISELKFSEEKLARTNSMLQATLDSTADGILVVDLKGNIVTFNERFIEQWQIPPEVIESRSDEKTLEYVLDQLKDPDDFIKRVKHLYGHPELESLDSFEFKSGRVFERYSRAQRINQLAMGRVWSFRDVTERKRAEAHIQEYAGRQKALADASQTFANARLDLKSVLEATSVRVAEHYQDGCIVRLFSEDQLQLETVAFHHVDPATLEVMKSFLATAQDFIDDPGTRELLRTGKGVLVNATPEEARLRFKAKYLPVLERFPLHSWITVPLRVAGETLGTMTIFRFRAAPPYTFEDQLFVQDLGDRAALCIHNAQLYLAAKRAIQLREDFMAIASHELRTPLTPLKMQLQLFTHLVRTGVIVAGPMGERLKKIVEDSDQQISRLTRLIEDMLDSTRLKTGRLKLKFEPVELNQLLDSVLENLKEQLCVAGCAVEFRSQKPALGTWDRLRIEQVLINLLTNAMKFGQGKPIHISLTTLAGKAIISVRDFGIGIAQRDQHRIFERFERAVSISGFGGLGMGLYIARQIVELHGGWIQVESTPGEGSKFTVTLPLSEVRPTPDESRVAARS